MLGYPKSCLEDRDSMKKLWVVLFALSLVLAHGCGNDKTDMGTNSTGVQPGSTMIAPTNAATAPVAKFTANPTTGSIVTVFSFDGTASTGDNIGRFWDFGDGATVAGGKIITHKFRDVGTYNVRLRVKDGAGNIDFASRKITVLENAPPVAQFTVDPTSGGAGTKFHFDASASSDLEGPIAAYRWDFGDNSTGQGKLPVHSYAKEGTYKVTLTVKDRKGQEATADKQVKVESGGGGALCRASEDSTSRPAEPEGGCYGFSGIQKFVITGVAFPQIRVDHPLHTCHGKPELRRIGAEGMREFLGDVRSFSCGGTVLTLHVYGLPGYQQPKVGERAYLVYLH